MVWHLTDTFEAPFENEVWLVDGKPTQHFYDFMNQLSINNKNFNEGIFVYSRFADLSAVQAIIQVPTDGFTVIFEGQGLGTYNESANQWRLSADDTTAVT